MTTKDGKFLEQPLKSFDFATVISAKKLKGSGICLGDEVLIMSVKDVAFKKDDPYLKRTLFIVALVKEGIVCIPKDTNNHKSYVVDPRSLEKVSEERRTELMRQFGGE